MAFNSKYSAKKYLNADELNNSRSNENDRKNDEKADTASMSSSDNDEDTGVNFIKEGEKRVSELNAFINSQKDLYRKMHSQTKPDQNLYKDDDEEDEDDDEDATEGDEIELEEEDRHRLMDKQSSGSTIVNAADNEEEEDDDNDRQQLLKEFKENLKFKKYLNDLKKSYLDNLSLSCPSKISIKSGSQTSITNSNRSSQGAKRKILFENLASNITQEMSINRSNGTEDDEDEDDDDDDDEKVSLSLRDNLVRKSTDEAGSKDMLSTEQILSRLQQIREYLKQAYSMLGTLESSNELANYSPQMNKLHSLIEHLKDQEKGYMDLLNSLRLYEKLSKDEKQRHTSVTSKTSTKSANSTLVSETESKKASKKQRREESLSLSGSLISDTITLEAEAKKQRKVKSDIDEQERLLKSINQRREELRALEGRRKALEALKLEAIANEKDLMAKVDAKMKSTSNSGNTMAAQKMKLENFQKRFAELAASATDALPKSEIKSIGDEVPEAMEPLSVEDKMLLQDRLNDLQTKKQAVDQLLVDLNRLKQGSGGSGGDLKSSGADVKSSVVVKNVVKKELDEQDEKMKTLIENQAKLDKLYAMQTRLDQLKSIVGHFNDEKNLDSILSNYEAKLNDDDDNDEEINEDEDNEDLKQNSGYKDLYMKKLRRERYVEAKEPQHQQHQQQQQQQQTMMLDELKAQSQKQLTEHKKKLNNAKEKLRQLQGLISTIQNVDDDENIDDKDDDDEVDDDDEDFGGLLSGSGRDDEYKQQNVVRNWTQHNHDAALDLSLSSEKQQQRNAHETSSDALWAQMKQQLKMRDKLRGKKKELEDVIRNECSDFKARNSKGKSTSSVVANEISLGDESRLSSVSSRRPKLQQQQQQQENLDDLISLSNFDYEANNASVFNASINGLKKQLHESSETFGCMIDNQKKLTSLLERNLAALSQNQNQSQSQSQIHSSCNSDVGSFVHMQNQMQIQQLVFNLNAAYREIALQRNEINQLTSQMNQLNAHLFTNTNSNKSSQITTNADKVESPEKKQQQQQQDDSETIHTYVDDFEPESSGAQQQHNSKQSSKVSKSVNAAIQRAVSTTSSSSNDSNGNTNMVLLEKNSEYLRKRLNQSRNNMMHHNNNNKNSTSSSSVTSCGKAKSAPATTSNSSTTFDQLRESIYSEVATLISQNETRPQYLLNLFRELQHLQTKNSRDQALKSIFNISSRQSTLVQSQDESIKVSKIDDEATAPFANDALGDTVIYLHMSESAKPKSSTIKNTSENLNNLNNSKSFTNNMLYTCSSNSSVVSVREKNLSEYHISHDVPLIVERAMAMLKYDKESVFDESMMKMLIYKIVMVLRQQKQHLEYLRLYESQLSSYLAEALSNYLQVPIDACRNEIFYDVQDILRNELTFYSITSQKKEAKSAKANSSGSNIVVISSPRKVHGGNLENYGDEDSDGYEITGEYDLAKASAASNANCNNKINGDDEDNLIKLAEQLSYEDDDDEEDDDDDDDDDELEGTYKVMADEIETVRNVSTAGSMRLKDIVGKNETIDLGQYEKYQSEHAKSSLGGAQMMSSSSAFIELAPSEIKPYSRIGSDEDENEQDDDDSQMSDNLETAVSRQPHIIASSQSQPKFESSNNDAATAEITIEDLPKNFTFTNLFEDKDGDGDEKKGDKECEDDLVTMENILLQSIADNIVDQNEYPGPMFGHRCNVDESNEEIDKLNSEFIKLISSHINEVSREGKQQQEGDVNDNEQDYSDSSGDVDEVKRVDDDRNTSEA